MSGAPSPDFPGRIFSFGTLTLSKINSPVEEALNDHLLWVSGVEKPSMPLSTITPCILLFSSLAHTIAMSANGEFEIHILDPFNIIWSPWSLKLVIIPPGFEPWSGSVSPKHPIISPVASLGKNFSFCSSLPNL